jgi:hypothetical protein
MENIQLLTEASVKIVILIKHLNNLWTSPNVHPHLKNETKIKLRNFFSEAPLILADTAILLKNPKLVDEVALQNIVADVSQLTASALSIVNDVRDLTKN